jgi:hypothetical protein
VRVAAVRNPSQATPIRGSYLGDAALFQDSTVTVHARTIATAS